MRQIAVFLLLIFAANWIELINAQKSDYLTANTSVIEFNPPELELELNQNKSLELTLKLDQIDNDITIHFLYGDEKDPDTGTNGIIANISDLTFRKGDSNKKRAFTIYSTDVGKLVITPQSYDLTIPLTDILRLSVIHSGAVNVLIEIVGWTYFAAWSISFWPQVILNYQKKSVEGLNLDYAALNFIGHSCYCVFNVAFYWVAEVKNQYQQLHLRGVNPVLLNDVFFSMHAVLLTVITLVQCAMYRKYPHRVSNVAVVLIALFVSTLAIAGIVCIASAGFTILQYIYFFTYVKLAITMMKYIPQAYMNYKRKSTQGWSIINVLLDFTGGSLSVFQMFLLSYNYNDWTSIFGSPTKLGLGLLSIFFDLLFMAQHYIFYREKPPQERPLWSKL